MLVLLVQRKDSQSRNVPNLVVEGGCRALATVEKPKRQGLGARGHHATLSP